MTSRYPLDLHTCARPIPVFPAVPSTTVPPGFNSPRSSASLTTYKAARSLTLPPGFWNSDFPRILQPVSSESVFNRIRGVFPIARRSAYWQPGSNSRSTSSQLIDNSLSFGNADSISIGSFGSRSTHCGRGKAPYRCSKSICHDRKSLGDGESGQGCSGKRSGSVLYMYSSLLVRTQRKARGVRESFEWHHSAKSRRNR